MARTVGIITIDGSHGEAGGAIVRAALVMAAMTQQAVRIEGVRAGTKFPGLDAEDLTIAKTLARSVDADITGAQIGSQSLLFAPKSLPKKLEGSFVSDRNDNGRGANALIVLSTLLPVLARSGAYSQINIEGETYGRASLSFDYFENVILGVTRAMNVYAEVELKQSSFSRDEAGLVSMAVEPCSFQGLTWTERGRPTGLHAVVALCRLEHSIGERARNHLTRLAQSAHLPIEIDVVDVPGHGAGMYATVWTKYEGNKSGTGRKGGLAGFGAIGAKGVRVESIVQQAFDATFDWMTGDATLDPFSAETVLFLACFSENFSEFKISEITPRLLSIVWVMKQFLPVRIVVRGSEGGPGTISVGRG